MNVDNNKFNGAGRMTSKGCLGRVAIAAIAALLVAGAIYSQEQQPEKPKVINQHCKVVADILPLNLEGELKKLNTEGRTIDTMNGMYIVGDKFTIVDCDPTVEDEEEGR